MTRSRVSAGDRVVLAACVSLALVAAVVPAISLPLRDYPGAGPGFVGWSRNAAIGVVPECAALAAVVLTRVRWAGVAIGVAAALLGALAALVALPLGGLGGLGLGFVDLLNRDLVILFGWAIAFALPLLVADVVARRIGSFTPGTGALTGALVGVVAVVLYTVSLGTTLGSEVFELPLQFWFQTYAALLLALVATGAVSGTVAQAQRQQVHPETGQAA